MESQFMLRDNSMFQKFFGDSVLSDFGSAVQGDEKRNHNANHQVYRVRKSFNFFQQLYQQATNKLSGT